MVAFNHKSYFIFKQTELQLLQTALIETKCQILQALAGAMDRPASKQMEVMNLKYHALIMKGKNTPRKRTTNAIPIVQVIASAEETLKDFEQRITELKTRGAALQADQISANKLLKLQVNDDADYIQVYSELLQISFSLFVLY